MPVVMDMAMSLLQVLNDLVHLPVIEYVLYFGFVMLQLLMVPSHILCFLALGVVDVCSGYVWWTYDEPTDDRPIVITGCSRGLGHDLAVALNAAGWRVYAGCRSEKDMASLSAKCAGGKLTAVMLDVTNNEHVQALRRRLEKECPKGLYALVNNAGYAMMAPVDWMSEGALRKTMEVNFFGVVGLTQALLPLLKAYGRGARVVNNSSVAGLVAGAPGMGAYGASKHALEIVSSSLRAELYGWGIHVCVVNPSMHRTDMVHGITDTLAHEYKHMPQHKQDEYGEHYLQDCAAALGTCTSALWDPRHVVKALTHATTGHHPRGQYLVGLDAKFVYPALLHLPHRVIDYALGTLFAKIVPARLAKHTALHQPKAHKTEKPQLKATTQ